MAFNFDTGLYGLVRHPMYSATIILFLAIPLVLGSLISFVVFLFYPFLIAKRIKNEEAVLTAELQNPRLDCTRNIGRRTYLDVWNFLRLLSPTFDNIKTEPTETHRAKPKDLLARLSVCIMPYRTAIGKSFHRKFKSLNFEVQ